MKPLNICTTKVVMWDILRVDNEGVMYAIRMNNPSSLCKVVDMNVWNDVLNTAVGQMMIWHHSGNVIEHYACPPRMRDRL